MPILDCSVNTCTHYSDNCCCLSNIKVDGEHARQDGDTCCGSFYEESGSASNSSQDPNTQLSVDCDAVNCTFNEDMVCRANHIGIAGSKAKNSEETKCASFRVR